MTYLVRNFSLKALLVFAVVALASSEETSSSRTRRDTSFERFNRAMGRVRLGKRPLHALRLGKRGDSSLPLRNYVEDRFEFVYPESEIENAYERRQITKQPRFGRELEAGLDESAIIEDLYSVYKKLQFFFDDVQRDDDLRQTSEPRLGRSKRDVNQQNQPQMENSKDGDKANTLQKGIESERFKRGDLDLTEDFRHYGILTPRLGYKLRSNIPALGPENEMIANKRATALMRLGKRLNDNRAMGVARLDKRPFEVTGDTIPSPENRALPVMRLGRSANKQKRTTSD